MVGQNPLLAVIVTAAFFSGIIGCGQADDGMSSSQSTPAKSSSESQKMPESEQPVQAKMKIKPISRRSSNVEDRRQDCSLFSRKNCKSTPIFKCEEMC